MLLLFFPLLNTDTTSAGYKAGYAIGELIPFMIIAAVFIWLMWKRYFSNK